MVFGTFRIYGYRLCFAVRGFRKRCSRARFRDSFAACFAVRGFRACVLLFEAFGSDVPKAVKEFFWLGFWPFSARVQMVFGTFRIYGYRLCFAVRGFRACVLLFEAFGSSVQARFREAHKIVFVDSKGNVKEFFWLGFWPFSARVQMVFGTFRIYGYRLCFAVRGFRKRCSMARFRDSFAACFRALFPSSLIEGSCALSLLFLSVVFVFPLPFFRFRGYHLQCYLQMGYNQLHPCRLFAWRGLESFRSCVS